MSDTLLQSRKRKASHPLIEESGSIEQPSENKKSSHRHQKVSLKGDAPPLGKFLASNSKATRDRAVDALRKFLRGKGRLPEYSDQYQYDLFQIEFLEESWEPIDSNHHRFDEIELAKLYKGLFYCYWMSDKPIVQQQLAQDLADLCLIIRPSKTPQDRLLDLALTTQSALSLWKGFWKALAGEWQGVDKHRLDKYLLLMRRFVEVAFKILQRANWHTCAINLWTEILKETVFDVADFKTPLSITYHYSDIFLDELNRVLETRPEPPAPIVPLLEPLVHALSHTRPGTATFKRIIDNVFEPLFANFDHFIRTEIERPNKSSAITIYSTFETHLISSKAQSSQSETELSKRFRLIRRDVLSLLFKAGSSPLCPDSNRRKIYSYWHSKSPTENDDPLEPED